MSSEAKVILVARKISLVIKKGQWKKLRKKIMINKQNCIQVSFSKVAYENWRVVTGQPMCLCEMWLKRIVVIASTCHHIRASHLLKGLYRYSNLNVPEKDANNLHFVDHHITSRKHMTLIFKRDLVISPLDAEMPSRLRHISPTDFQQSLAKRLRICPQRTKQCYARANHTHWNKHMWSGPGKSQHGTTELCSYFCQVLQAKGKSTYA